MDADYNEHGFEEQCSWMPTEEHRHHGAQPHAREVTHLSQAPPWSEATQLSLHLPCSWLCCHASTAAAYASTSLQCFLKLTSVFLSYQCSLECEFVKFTFDCSLLLLHTV